MSAILGRQEEKDEDEADAASTSRGGGCAVATGGWSITSASGVDVAVHVLDGLVQMAADCSAGPDTPGLPGG